MEKEKEEYTHVLLLFPLDIPAFSTTFDLESLHKKCKQNKSRQKKKLL